MRYIDGYYLLKKTMWALVHKETGQFSGHNNKAYPMHSREDARMVKFHHPLGHEYKVEKIMMTMERINQ